MSSSVELTEIAEAPPAGAGGLARSAAILAAGSLAGRLLGLVREVVIAALFGATGQVSAFRVAAQVPTLFYDFLVGGMLSAALVPVLSDYARRSRSEFAQIVGALLSLFAIVLALLVLLLEALAPGIANLLAAGFQNSNPELLALTTQLLRLLAPLVWLLSMAGVVTGVLYALQRFTFPAIATAVFNLGIVVAAPLLAGRLGIYSLAVGLLAGATAQLTLMALDMHRAGVRWLPRASWRHPALRRIGWLYLPIAAGLLVSSFQIGLDRRLASGTGASSIAWMANATTLQQMPLGLISVAISLAALPRLSQYFAARDEIAYRQTLARGLRMVWLLIAPAAVLLWLLAEPVTRLVFERRAFTPADTLQVARALDIYLIGMLFAALDFPLNFAFYARNNTLLPALVGAGSVVVYTVVALALVGPLGYLGLVWADTAKQAAHLLVMAYLLWRIVGRLGAATLPGFLRIGAATSIMAAVAWATATGLAGRLPLLVPSFAQDFLLVAVTGAVALTTYLALLSWMQVPEARLLLQTIRRRLPRTS